MGCKMGGIAKNALRRDFKRQGAKNYYIDIKYFVSSRFLYYCHVKLKTSVIFTYPRYMEGAKSPPHRGI
jgi:hypothetical protein